MIKDTIFLGNLALKGGGALDCENGGELDIERSVFTYNNANGLENDPTCSGQGPPIGCTEGGGAIMSGCKTDILHSLFEANFAYGQLGGGGLLLTDGPKSTITQSVFRWNGAGFGAPTISNIGQGGAIFARGNVLIDSSAIQENWVKGSGGGIFFENSDSQVVNTVLLANHARSSTTARARTAAPSRGSATACSRSPTAAWSTTSAPASCSSSAPASCG